MSGSTLIRFLPHISGVILFIGTLVAAGHAVLCKRDSRAAIGWIGVILIFPGLGALLYVLLGINRIRRKAVRERTNITKFGKGEHPRICSLEMLREMLPRDKKHLVRLGKVSEQVTRHELLCDNSVTPLMNGDEAYPEMISAIHNARCSVALATYIFGNDEAGREFTDALRGAVKRGVEVCVLIDDVGSRYSFPPIVHQLRRRGIRVKRFMPTYAPWWTPFMNLRNHRKMLIVDGMWGFTGGMNIQAPNVLKKKMRHAVQDVHFKIAGPVVRHIQKTFIEDWEFASGEVLKGEQWLPEINNYGDVVARGITDGPDEDFIRLQKIMLGALACAEYSIRIVTPYFLPELELISALNGALMRGVTVDIVLPGKNNHRIVSWASTAELWQILEWGAKVWLTPPPFDHSKIMVVDDTWSLIGSANWDPRSLRLNFEFNIECYSQTLSEKLNDIITQKMYSARRLHLHEINRRSLLRKLRDGVARLFTPYL